MPQSRDQIQDSCYVVSLHLSKHCPLLCINEFIHHYGMGKWLPFILGKMPLAILVGQGGQCTQHNAINPLNYIKMFGE